MQRLVEDLTIKPVLIRACIPTWGTQHDIVASFELVGGEFGRTMVGAQVK